MHAKLTYELIKR